MIDDEELIPELKEWRDLNKPSFDVEDWISIEGNIKLAIGYSVIFWPDFIEHENCVFLKSHFSVDGFNQWKNVDYVEFLSQIEDVINHIHILDLFTYQKQADITGAQVRYLGNILRTIYEVKLKTEFKGRDFVVTFNEHDQLEDLIDYQVSFYQKHNETKKTRNGS